MGGCGADGRVGPSLPGASCQASARRRAEPPPTRERACLIPKIPAPGADFGAHARMSCTNPETAAEARGCGACACARLRRPGRSRMQSATLRPPQMRFFEYESRAIVGKAGLPVTKHGFATTADEARGIAEDIAAPVVIKSQVLTGGRMKAGGVQFADTPDEAAEQAEHVLNLDINGHMPRGVLVDSKAAVKHEYYAGVVWDGIRKQPVMLFSDMGGIDIEEVAEEHPDHVARGHFSTLRPFSDWQAKQVIASIGVTGSALNRLTPILARLARLFLQYDMTLAEINPLGQLTDASFIALEAHMARTTEARPPQTARLEG